MCPQNYCYCIYFLETEWGAKLEEVRKMKNQPSFVLQGELLLTFLWEWRSASWNGNVPDQGKGELALCSHLWVTRLPKHASICQTEFKAHSSHGNSEFPFLLSSEVAKHKRGGDTANGWVQKSLSVLRTPFFEATDCAQCKLKAFPALYSFPTVSGFGFFSHYLWLF